MASSDSNNDGAAPGGVWPSRLTLGQTEDLFWFGLLMPPPAKVPRPWRISTDGYPMQGPPATNAELSAHPARPPRGLPVGDITGEAGPSRPRRRAPPPTPAPPAPAEAVTPPEQAMLQQDGDPEDTPGLLVALARLAKEAAAAAAREAKEQAAALAAVEAAVAAEQSDDDDDGSDDDDGGDGGMVEVIDLSMEE
nr:wiskott-Aldrich syndrome protein family member 2-like [Aegilops tauschii subsp. strangulata]